MRISSSLALGLLVVSPALTAGCKTKTPVEPQATMSESDIATAPTQSDLFDDTIIVTNTVGDTTGDTTDDSAEETTDNTTGDDAAVCEPLDTDYQPTIDDSANDAWNACITDGGAYELVADTPSSIARVQSFETIADLLWRKNSLTADDFTTARLEYSADEKLESRVVRREDLHYDPIPVADHDPAFEADKQCSSEANVEKYPDRCAGPSQIAPLLNDAFVAGQSGEGNVEIQAAKIEAGLLWFLYISTYKECSTCTLKAKDCDSCWAYYTGGFDRDGGIGLSGIVSSIDESAHNAIWDGFSAVRCWRDQYPETDFTTWDEIPAVGQQLHGQGLEQLDNALHKGFAAAVTQRMQAYLDADDADEAAPHWAFLQIAGPVLDREVAQRGDDSGASSLDELWDSKTPTAADVKAGLDIIESAIPCPQP